MYLLFFLFLRCLELSECFFISLAFHNFAVRALKCTAPAGDDCKGECYEQEDAVPCVCCESDRVERRYERELFHQTVDAGDADEDERACYRNQYRKSASETVEQVSSSVWMQFLLGADVSCDRTIHKDGRAVS